MAIKPSHKFTPQPHTLYFERVSVKGETLGSIYMTFDHNAGVKHGILQDKDVDTVLVMYGYYVGNEMSRTSLVKTIDDYRKAKKKKLPVPTLADLGLGD